MTLDAALRAAGAAMAPVCGVDAPQRFTTMEQEVTALRRSAVVSALPHVAVLRLSGDDAYDALDRIVPAELHIGDGRIRHTLLLRDDGRPLADLYLCRDDDRFLLLAEGAPPADIEAHLRDHLPRGAGVTLDDLTPSHAVLSLNGPFAWEVMAALEGQGIIGFPYLSFFSPSPGRTYLRAGKTGEFGYDLVVPRGEAGALWSRILEVGAPLDVAPAGFLALWHCALENWFFNIHREGALGLTRLTPIELQLQWRLSFTKDSLGVGALREHRKDVTHRITALEAAGPMAPGDEVLCDDRVIGSVLHAERSVSLGVPIGIGLLELPYAHSGVDRYAVRGGDRGALSPVRTLSAPFINNMSLFLDAQRHSYRRRADVPFPGFARHRAPAAGRWR